jgi:hypothetical protein
LLVQATVLKSKGGYNDEVFTRLIALCKVSLQKMQATSVISGMALGFDQAHEEAAIELQIPLIAAVPFKGQDDLTIRNSQFAIRNSQLKI